MAGPDTLGLAPTLIIAGLTLGLTVFCGWRGAIPLKTILKPRMVPWRPLMVVSFVAWVAIMAHLVTLVSPT
jgi:hypothetical protein